MGLHVNRRSFLIGSASLGLLTACGGGIGSGGNQPDRLGARFADGLRAPSTAVTDNGLQRFPFIVVGTDQLPMVDGAPAFVEMEVIRDGTTIATEMVPARGVGQVIPFYPLEFEPPETGRYIIRTEFSEFDFELAVVDRSETPVFQVGEELPAFDTPTFDDARGVDPVCTRPGGPCPFHEITLTEALDNDRPTAILIATPQFCQTDVCGPSVENLISNATGRDDINIIHAEVFENFARDTDNGDFPERAPLLIEWQVDFEPSLFVAGADNTIVGAKHFAFDSDETADLLALI